MRGLWKSYGRVQAVRDLSLRVHHGEVFALLGPNGAGKTTTIEILEGHRRRDAGEVSVLGRDPGRGDGDLRARIGIVLQSTSVEPYLTVEETVAMFGGYYPRPLPVDDVLRATGLEEERGTLVRRLSGGQQRRLDVAIGLAGDPELLFLDEPTTGFDPAARRAAWDMIAALRALGKTILLTTHYLDEAQRLADRVAIVVAGRVVAEGPPSSLAAGEEPTLVRFRLPPEATFPDLGLHGVPERRGDEVELRTPRPTEDLHAITEWALRAGVELGDLAVSPPSLEEAYLHLTEERTGEGAGAGHPEGGP